MFSPLYVGLYLYKSYTGEGGEDDDEQPLVCKDDEQGSRKLVPKKETEISDEVVKKPDDTVDGPHPQRHTETQGEQINDLLCSRTENDITTNTDLSSQILSFDWDHNDDGEHIISEMCDSDVTNNNNCSSSGLLSDVLEYPYGDGGEKSNGTDNDDNDYDGHDDDYDHDHDNDETCSVEFVDSQLFEEDIRSAEIKQNQQLVRDLMEPNQMPECDTLEEVTITPSKITNKICVAETKVLRQDSSSQNESMFYKDIKQKSSSEVSTPCNNDKKATPVQCESAKKGNINDQLFVNGLALDSSSVSTLCCTKRVDCDAPSYSCHSETIGEDKDYNGAIGSVKSNLDDPLSFSSKEVLKETAFASSCTTRPFYNHGCSTDNDETTMWSSSAVEQTANVSNLSAKTRGAVEPKGADNNQEIRKPIAQISCKQNVKPSLGKCDFLSNSDDLSDLSDTVVADDLTSNSSISDLPEDGFTSSSVKALLRPSNLELSSAAITNNEKTSSEDAEPSVTSPSKVSVTCITEEETIAVEEVVISPNHHHHSDKSFFDNSDKKRKSTISPEATSNCIRSGALSSTERLDFDWNEHCLRMIVTGTPDNSLNVAVAGTPKSSENQGRLLTGSDRISQSNDFSGSNKDMQEDVETLRLKVENKNEEILRLKNITEGLRHRLTKVEQQNMRLSQSSDSFLSVPSERPSSTSSCYDSVVSLSYEGNMIRSPSLEENLLLKEEIHLLKSQLESKSNTIRRLNSKTNEMKARLIEEEQHVKTDSENENNVVARRKVIRPVKSVNDISVEEKPRMLPISMSGSASSVFVNSTTVPINSSLSEQTSKKKKKKRRLFSFGKKKDKNK